MSGNCCYAYSLHLHSAPFFAVRKQFWQNLLKRGENEFYTDHCRHSNQLV